VKLPLRHVMDMPHQDVRVYEHTKTGERRRVTGKSRVTLGLEEAWKQAKPKTTKSTTTGQTDVVS